MAPVYGPTSRLALGTWIQVAPPLVVTSRMPPSKQPVVLFSMFGRCQNLSTTGFSPAGSAIGGEISRWSESDDGSVPRKCWVPACGLAVEIVQVSVPTAALCVQLPAPASKPSVRTIRGIVPGPQSPGAATVVKLQTAESVPVPQVLTARTRQ
ncbi:MAG: hypothetical protein BWY91_02823 [bacterium ADurb.BinA028]|nr:MAG: hypothetical protein BWY91_02823 [bacterium ADurb.BinA028]